VRNLTADMPGGVPAVFVEKFSQFVFFVES
jgi:hypothetical protein